MSNCQDAAISKCDESSTLSKASEEGKWVAIIISLWIVVLVLFWVFRTCTQPQRRRKLIQKFACCLQKLGWAEADDSSRTGSSDQGGEDDNDDGHVDGNVSRAVNQSSGEHQQHQQRHLPIVSHHSPSSYQDGVLLAPSGLMGSLPETCGQQVRQKELNNNKDNVDDIDDDSFSYDADSESIGATSWSSGNGRQGGRFRSRQSRNSLSSVSITLATIEEDDNEHRHSSHSQPELRIPDVRVTIKETPSRSKSVPSKLFTMASSSCSSPSQHTAIFTMGPSIED